MNQDPGKMQQGVPAAKFPQAVLAGQVLAGQVRFPRTGGQILVDQLLVQGVDRATCVPGESYLAVLDALHDAAIDVLVCRQEGGAAMMADAYARLTGRPGICFVTRGPGASNAAPGIHIAMQDSSPLIVFVGQVERGMREREAFQELDYKAVFGTMAKWAVEIDAAARIPEIVARAFRVATQGRPGPGRGLASRGRADRDGDGRGRAARRAGAGLSGRSRDGEAPGASRLGRAAARHPRRLALVARGA